jgi:eukaryotic-like serine/threonine-protein kinase
VSATPISLSPGDRLGRYEIVALLGAGGMGEVYRARDPHLKRDVALKVVRRPAANPEQIARFTREARAASSLNHPNIVAVYDAGVEGGTPYVVTELLEGETLRARLDRGPLPFRKAVDYGIHIALALDAAHARGIWHRDVKPGNAFVMNDGRVKLLDFGIAKLSERGLQAESEEPTSDLSESREVLGTAGYMSPEQVLGQPLDHRTDIFALGAVLYEMFTRTRAFKRGSAVETMNAVLHDDPADPLTLNPGLSPMAATIVRRCLEKNKEERFQSARDLAFGLQQLRDVTGGTKPIRVPVLARRKVMRAIAAALLLLAALAAGTFLRRLPAPPAFEQLTFARARISAARFVADGRAVVYSEAREKVQPELLRIDPEENRVARNLGFAAGTEILAAKAGEIAVSVNRRFIMGERFAGTLAVAPLGSSTPREEQNDVEQADWDSSGKQMAVVRSPGGTGGTTSLEYPIGTKRYETGSSIRFPRISRDGTRIAFLEDAFGSSETGHVSVLNLADNHVAVLTKNWRSARGLAWSADGREIWFTAGESRANRMLYAVKPDHVFKSDPSKPDGGDYRLVIDPPGSMTLFDITPDGRVLLTLDDDRRVLTGGSMADQTERDLSWFDDSGLADVADDGTAVLFSDRFGVYVRGTDGSGAVRLGNIDAFADDLSPDGSKALATTTTEPSELVILPRKAGTHHVMSRYNITAYSGARWFPDGRIIFTGMEAGRQRRSYVQSPSGGPPTPVTPEGVWVVSLDTTGKMGAAIGSTQPGISIIPLDGGPSRMVPGSQHGDRPVAWTDDSKALWIYRRFEVPAQIIRLDIATGKRQIWKTLVPSDLTGVTEFAITPSGSAYYYSYKRLLSQLYQVRGLR